jgi:hypothetical protein
MPTKRKNTKSKYKPFMTRGVQQQKIIRGFMNNKSPGQIAYETYTDLRKDTKTIYLSLLGLSEYTKNIQLSISVHDNSNLSIRNNE